jgi:anhydro-N-acetylmuramic acid kinase
MEQNAPLSRVIGLISGTSADGIDAVLVDLAGTTWDLQVTVRAAATSPYPETLRSRILAVCHGELLSMETLADLDDSIARCFAQAAQAVQTGHFPAHLIGSHGQTVFHRPPIAQPLSLGYSLQLGRGEAIAHHTGIPTVSNFRAADIAMGGQGAPLVPPIDACLLSHPTQDRCVQNIGGIGNVTYLPATGHLDPGDRPDMSTYMTRIQGWDTGPGNALIDLAVTLLSNGRQTYDQNGAWAAQGKPHLGLIEQWLQQDPFFQLPPPKSTGREWFGADYAQRCLQDAARHDLSPADTLATLTEFTAATIADSYRRFLPQRPAEVILGGGGCRNCYLVERLRHHLAPATVNLADTLGIPVDFKEAIAFAVLAYWKYRNITGNAPSVTGAKRPVVLGDWHEPALSIAAAPLAAVPPPL